MRKVLEIGGLVAGAVLIVFGVVAIVMGVNGRSTVNSAIKAEQIVGSADMTPAGDQGRGGRRREARPEQASDPDLPVANTPSTTARPPAASRSTCGSTRSRRPAGSPTRRWASTSRLPNAPKSQLMVGGGTDNKVYARDRSDDQAAGSNGARNVWVTETALTTALNTSYMASQLALFGLVVGIALLLSGFGFAILAIGGALRNPASSLGLAFGKRTAKAPVPTPVPTV